MEPSSKKMKLHHIRAHQSAIRCFLVDALGQQDGTKAICSITTTSKFATWDIKQETVMDMKRGNYHESLRDKFEENHAVLYRIRDSEDMDHWGKNLEECNGPEYDEYGDSRSDE